MYFSQLEAKLGHNGARHVEPLGRCTGGRNEGLWLLKYVNGSNAKYVLKLISCHRCHYTVPTETETFLKLSKEHPGLSTDKEMAFPLKLFACQNPGPRRYDLIVMRPAPGLRVTEVLHNKWHRKQIEDIMKILRCIGACLKRFHVRYRNTQHADLNSSNIFWDDATGAVTFIDLGGMGCPTIETDNEYFKKAFRMMVAKTWGAITEEACRMFDAGYNDPMANGRDSVSWK